MNFKLFINLLFVFAVQAVHAQPNSSVEFYCSDAELEKGFAWARHQALAYVNDKNDPVGPWYEASLPGRDAFCMRDVSHQLIGANVLGLAHINKNLLQKFAKSIAASRDWCGYWEIDKLDRPAPVDYKNDQDFWYNLPANFDVIDACYRQYLWTGDDLYLNDPAFRNFYMRSCDDYVKQWDKNGDGIMEGTFASKPTYRGIGSYNEEQEGITGSDLIGAQFIGYRAYADLLDLASKDNHPNAKAYRAQAEALQENFIYAWWDVKENFPFQFLKKDGSKIHNNPLQLFLLRWNMLHGDRAKRILNVLLQERSKMNVEMFSYFPLEQFRYGNDHTKAIILLKELMSPNLKRREYPEVSYAALEATAMGLMGIQPDASKNSIITLPRLTSNMTAEIKHLPILKTILTIKHGPNRTTLINEGNESIYWKACLNGTFINFSVNTSRMPAQWEKSMSEHTISFVTVEVKPGEHLQVEPILN